MNSSDMFERMAMLKTVREVLSSVQLEDNLFSWICVGLHLIMVWSRVSEY